MITAKQARALFLYDSETGLLHWKEKGRGRRSTVGNVMDIGYLRVWIGSKRAGRSYQVHRLIWLLVTGRWPKGEIDHIDGDRANNRWANLRRAAHFENSANMPMHKDNSTGYKGVFPAPNNRFKAQIMTRGKKISLGSFGSAKEAHAAYVVAAKKYHGEFARLK